MKLSDKYSGDVVSDFKSSFDCLISASLQGPDIKQKHMKKRKKDIFFKFIF